MDPFGRLAAAPRGRSTLFSGEEVRKAEPNPFMDAITKTVYENDAREAKQGQLDGALKALGNKECTKVHLSVGVAVYLGQLSREEVEKHAREQYGEQASEEDLRELVDQVLTQGADRGESYQLHDIHLPPAIATQILETLIPHMDKPDPKAAAQALRDMADQIDPQQ